MKNLFTKLPSTLKRFLFSFWFAFTLPATILGVGDILFPNKLNWGYLGLGAILIFSFGCALIAIRPKNRISRQFKHPEAKITIKFGDLFEEDGNLVIGMSDTFDTEKGDIIKPQSVQGQFLTKIYNDDRDSLDTDIANELQSLRGRNDIRKHRGKTVRYPIGTAITLKNGRTRFFCSAYSYMQNSLQAISSIKDLSTSLEMLWEEVGTKGQQEKLSMAVLGSDLGRLANVASQMEIIKLICTLFILSSRKKVITPELVIVIYPKNRDKINMLELDDFLQNF